MIEQHNPFAPSRNELPDQGRTTWLILLKLALSLFPSICIFLFVFVGVLFFVFGNSSDYWPTYIATLLAIMAVVGFQLFLFGRKLQRFQSLSIFVFTALIVGAFLGIVYYLDIPEVREGRFFDLFRIY
jgi:hypothetical protein